MSKKILTFAILIIVLAGVFIPTNTAHAGVSAWLGLDTLVTDLFKAIGYILMTISAFILTISGWIFDKVVTFTIVDMAKNINDQVGVGGAITLAWATLRDIANMCFIFVLLYAAFKTMFDSNFSNFGKTVRDIIIVALLINFSLFFSKVVIDASNIVAVGFYNSVVNQDPSSLGQNQSKGISTGYMNMLGLQTFYDVKMLDGFEGGPTQIMTVGIMSSIFMLITAVVLLMAGIMFAARFIILTFIMILSPVALIAYIIPGMKNQFEKWKSALIDQSFFAPIYFALTWVVFKLGTSLVKAKAMQGNETVTTTQSWANMTTNPQGTITLIFNYVLIIGFSIAALVISKQMASKTAGFKAISGGIGTAAIGGAAWAGRNTVGRASSLISETQRERLSKSNWGRATLWAADKGKKSSFDVRASGTLAKVPGLGGELGIMGKAGGKGGFKAVVDEKVKKKAQYAKDVYGQTDEEKEAFEEAKRKEETSIRGGRETKANQTKSEAESAENERKKYLDEKLRPNTERYDEIKKKKQQKEEELRRAGGNKSKSVEIQKELDALNASMVNERQLREEDRKVIEENDNVYKNLKQVAAEKEKARQEAEAKKNKKDVDEEEYSEETLAIKNAGKKRQEEFAERTKNRSPISVGGGALAGATAGAALGSVLGPIGSAIVGGIGAGAGAIYGEKAIDKAREKIDEKVIRKIAESNLAKRIEKKTGIKIPDSIAFKWAGNKAAARGIIKQIKEKSPNEKAADLIKEMKKADDEAKGVTEEKKEEPKEEKKE